MRVADQPIGTTQLHDDCRVGNHDSNQRGGYPHCLEHIRRAVANLTRVEAREDQYQHTRGDDLADKDLLEDEELQDPQPGDEHPEQPRFQPLTHQGFVEEQEGERDGDGRRNHLRVANVL